MKCAICQEPVLPPDDGLPATGYPVTTYRGSHAHVFGLCIEHFNELMDDWVPDIPAEDYSLPIKYNFAWRPLNA